MKIEELLEAVDQLDEDAIRLLRNRLDARENSALSNIDTLGVEEWMQQFYKATESFQQLSASEWDEIEWAMNVEYIEPFVDED